LIDVLLVGILWISFLTISKIDSFSPVGLGLITVLLYLYWTALVGEKVGFKNSALESLGKAFLLPPDCLIEWSAYNGLGQRALNKFFNTFVASANEMK
jgi:hypothetical protein